MGSKINNIVSNNKSLFTDNLNIFQQHPDALDEVVAE